ncbi:MarR family winged helix-turn-helix transcriptional regulator [Paraburkholderia pallida]|uniref:MarR family transcriptional regulator n=1 Tax=Paraburkholderia pallida TaxID=2547399 RepID=A0A4P7D7G8_9BURK|nr:MarR family transcriptional regulator [Paraburkholderia pallida]QBR04138.1 MarR family transcriptional regulator [Paraburkholderia pallida]
MPVTRSPIPTHSQSDEGTGAPLFDETVVLQSEALGFVIRQVHRAFVRKLVEHLAPYDISPAQWTALRALWRKDGYSQVELAQRLHVEKAALTAVLESLEKKELIRRERSNGDKRRWNVYLTRTGRRLEADLLPLASQIDSEALRGFSREQIGHFRQSLLQVLTNLQ